MSKIEVRAFKYGESVLPGNMVFLNGEEEKKYPILFKVYLIIMQNRKILVDAGCETMPGFEMKNFIGTVKALEKEGISATDITDVIITHAHHDHIECVKYFSNALVYIQEDEYNAGKKYFAPQQKLCLFKDEITIAENIKILKIGGHSKGSSIVIVTAEKENLVFVGDECYLRECIKRKIPTGASVCPEKSREFIEKYGNGTYTLLFCHDE